MPHIYESEFKKKIVRLRMEEEPIKASLLNMEYPKTVSPDGAVNSAKNARQIRKPSKTMII